ncbi:MAG: hypothetical protein PHZ03_08255 [Syntrophomonas sp.]|nr:hypothetical protein [Syntrophomonas sp.]
MVISLSDFNKLSEKDKKKTLENLKQELGVSGIVKAWEISRSKVYSMLRESNISVNRKISRPSKTKKADASLESQNAATATHSPTERPGNLVEPEESQLDFDTKADGSKFFLNLETEGTAPLINETIHALLGSGKLSSANLHLSITLQEI